jgi:hypothetical protein
VCIKNGIYLWYVYNIFSNEYISWLLSKLLPFKLSCNFIIFIHDIYTRYLYTIFIHNIYTQYLHNIYTQYLHNINYIFVQYCTNVHNIYTQNLYNFIQYLYNIYTIF